MNCLREYLMSIIASALICTVLQTFAQQETKRALIRSICGVIMTVAVVAPLRKLDLSNFEVPELFMDSSADAAAEGEKMSREAIVQIIKSETEAYIQSKAECLGVQVEANVTLSDDTLPVPVAAEIRGELTDVDRADLENLLQTELGITKENMTWIG